MYIKQNLNLDHTLNLIPNYSMEGRVVSGAMWNLRKASSWVWIYTQGSMGGCLCSSSDKKREGDHFLCYLVWDTHSELTVFPDLHIFPIIWLGLAAGEAI